VNEPELILTVRQVGFDGSEVSTHLLRLAPGVFAIQDHRGQHEPFTAEDPPAAVRQGIRLAGEQETHIDRAIEDGLPLNDLLDALQIAGDPLDPEQWAEVGAENLGSLEATTLHWSTAHRLLIDGKAIFGIPGKDGETILVHADDPEAPTTHGPSCSRSTGTTPTTQP
jgi:hypothetical protein